MIKNSIDQLKRNKGSLEILEFSPFLFFPLLFFPLFFFPLLFFAEQHFNTPRDKCIKDSLKMALNVFI